MVEKIHTAGRFPYISEPLAHFRDRIANWFAPASEASISEDAYEIDLELPGVKTEDIEVSVTGNNLTVRGEKHSERKSEGRTYFFSEREYGAFQRTFRLPPDADTEKISAQGKDGVLSLSIPKRAAQSNGSQRIEVRKA